MSKPTYSKDDVVRVQKVLGGVVELRGKLAGDVEQMIAEETLINLSKPGYHVHGVVSGGFVPVPSEQRTLPLDDPGKQLKIDVGMQTVLANVAPSPADLDAFRKILDGKTIELVSFDDETGMWCLFIGPGVGQKGERRRLEFVTAQVKPMKPEPGKAKKEKAGDSKLSKADKLEYADTAQSEDDYLVKIGMADVIKKPGNYNNTIIACLMNYDESIADSPDVSLVDRCMSIDRWLTMHRTGCDDKQLLIHISEVFGGKKGRFLTFGDWTHQLIGDKKSPAIIFCHDLADGDLPAWVQKGDRENVLASGQKTGDGLIAVRELLLIPGPRPATATK